MLVPLVYAPLLPLRKSFLLADIYIVASVRQQLGIVLTEECVLH